MHVCCVYIRSNSCIYRSTDLNYYELRYDIMPLGISYISSSLKRSNHTTEMLFCTPTNCNDSLLNNIEQKPNIFAISIVSEEDFILFEKFIKLIKKHFNSTKIIVGGSFVTIVPNQVLLNKYVDALCIGEGEKAVVEYAKQVEENKFHKTENLWIRDNDGKIIKCDKSIFIDNIDDLPYPDRIAWTKWMVSSKQHKISLERGCTNHCIYCANHAITQSSKGNYVRYRSIQKIIEEIDFLKKQYNDLESIYFEGENVLIDTEYIKNFCNILATYNNDNNRKLNFSMQFNFTKNLLEDTSIILLMKKANINWIQISLESGSLAIRTQLQRPYYTNQQIIQFCETLRQQQIKSLIRVMYCFPFETKQTYLETINCLQKCKSDMVVSWLTPLKGTKLFDQLKYNKHKVTIVDKLNFILLPWRVYKTYKTCKEAVFLTIEPLQYFNKIIYVWKKFLQKQMNKSNNNKYKAKNEFDSCNYKQAIKYFNKIKIQETDYWVYGDRGIAKMNIGDYKGAFEDFDKAIELEPKKIYQQKRQECLNLLQNKQ